MSDLVRERFLPAFLATARTHVQKGLEQVSRGEAQEVWSTLRTLAGDAALVSVHKVVTAARTGEAAAHAWVQGGQDSNERATCVRSLEAVAQALDELDRPTPTP